ncbi:hypothetical protein CLOSTMETH_01905 [[Clostridium] methylpentosum DSM 5476]|uniref:Uncharacterized protein n=1 Tax=[Clostridium] methylpentosum DSM 5476 TaxID=537013 RepID=C0EDH8_9FIRM|nr:hypothetical protein CLOSTMETH_01905 [[Clostridium] methylpentosum DSM 5476]
MNPILQRSRPKNTWFHPVVFTIINLYRRNVCVVFVKRREIE